MSGRIFLGLDIGPDDLRAVALRRAIKKPAVLVGTRSVPLTEGILQLGLREPNILQPEEFVEAVREVLEPLAGRENRLAVTLGAGTGLVMVTEVESAFKSRLEGEEMLRWQLKNRLPVAPSEMHLDYQVLEKTSTGRFRLLVGAMVAAVLNQYETIFTAAGFNPISIDFHMLSLSNYYRPRFDFGNDFILLAIDGMEIGLLYFQGGVLRFYRARQMGRNSTRLIQELHRSLVTCQEEFPASGRAAVFLHGYGPRMDSLRETVSEIVERDVIALNRIQENVPDLELENPLPLAAAIGAAEGMM